MNRPRRSSPRNLDLEKEMAWQRLGVKKATRVLRVKCNPEILVLVRWSYLLSEEIAAEQMAYHNVDRATISVKCVSSSINASLAEDGRRLDRQAWSRTSKALYFNFDPASLSEPNESVP